MPFWVKWILATWTRRPAFRVKIVGNVGRDWTLFREVGIRDDANSLLSDLRTENTQVPEPRDGHRKLGLRRRAAEQVQSDRRILSHFSRGVFGFE